MEVINKGDVSANTIGEVASQLQVEPHEASRMVADARAGFEAQALSEAGKVVGADFAQDAMEWAYANAPELMREAIKNQTFNRDPRGYAEIARAYVADLERVNPEAILGATFGSGITASNVNGKVVLNIPGRGQVPYGVAVRSGLIRVS